MKIIVIGGGIVGVTTAYELMRDGHAVALIERQPGVAMECSHANGGYVAVSQAVPWSAPGVPTQTLLHSFTRDAPIVLHPSQLPRMWKWGLEFLFCSREVPSWNNTRHVLRLALYSHDVLKQTRNREAIDYHSLAKGCLKVFREQASLDHAAAVSEAQVSLGLNYKVLSASDCVAMAPALSPSRDKLAGGIHYGDEESGDCFAFCEGLAAICAAHGVEFVFNTSVRSLQCDGQRITAAITDAGALSADAFVLAAGADSPVIARSLGVSLPIIPVKGYSLTLPRDLWPDAPELPVLDEKRKFGYAPIGSDRLRMTGFAEINGYDTVPEARRTKAFVQSFVDLFPQLGPRLLTSSLQPFCCLRPVTPSGLPILGASRWRNLYYNAGQGHLGWTLAHGCARIVAATIAGREPDIDVTGYSPSAGQ